MPIVTLVLLVVMVALLLALLMKTSKVGSPRGCIVWGLMCRTKLLTQGSPTFRANSANRGSDRRGSSKESVFKPSSNASRS
jgi:hypothetical protein